MVFTILAACDLGGKCNFELTFPAKPSIADLRGAIDRDLGAESALRRPGVPFCVSRVQVFDERLQMWVDLVAAVQLEDYCQLYVFQMESPYCQDLPGHIPPPQRPTASPAAVHYDVSEQRERAPALYGGSVSPPRVRTASPVSAAAAGGALVDSSPFRSPDRAVVPTQADKVRAVYEDIDQARGRRGASRDDWRAAFERLRLSAPDGTLSVDTVDDLFTRKADANKDDYVDVGEFGRFVHLYPKLLDSMYYRKQALGHERARKDGLQRAYDERESLEKKQREADDAAREAESDALAHEADVAGAEDAVGGAQDGERAAKAARDAAAGEVEGARVAVRDAVGVRDRERDAVRQRDAEMRGAQRDAATQAKRRDAKRSEVDRAERELERLRQLVEQKEAELGRLTGELGSAEAAVGDAEAEAEVKAQEKAAAEAQAADKHGVVSEAEAALKDALEREADLAREHRARIHDVSLAQTEADRQKKQQQVLQQKADARERTKQRTGQVLDEHMKLLDQLEQKDQELDDKRRAQEAKENPIIEGEIRLREQRDTMEERESALSQAASEFAHETGRVLSPGSR